MAAESDSSAETWRSRTRPVPEDMDLQRVTWRFERIGWLVLSALVAAALLGAFSSGPASSGTAMDPQGRTEVEYERFARNGAAVRMQLRVRAGASERTVVRINASFMDAFMIEALHPRPLEERSGLDGAEMVFGATAGGPLRIYLDLRPQKVGPVASAIGLAGSAPARFAQFIFP